MLALFFGILSVFLVIKLNDILGKSIGLSKPEAEKSEQEQCSINEIEEPSLDVKKIKEHYREFNEQAFLKTVDSVFSSVFDAYAQGDKDTLKELLTPKLFGAFQMAIDDRKSRNEVLTGKVERIISSSIDSVKVTEDKIFVDVRFSSEQTNILRDATGKVIEGDPEFINTVQEIWTFMRSIDSKSKRWYLSEITYVSEQ